MTQAGQGLFLCLDMGNECFVGEAAIVAVLVLHRYAMEMGICFECSLGLNRLVSCRRSLEVHIGESAVVVKNPSWLLH
jgi:hypothetical protein